jgi:hypothetical protein
VISAVKGLMIFCALSFEHVFKSLFFLWREFFFVVKNAEDKRRVFGQKEGERGAGGKR